MGFSASVADSSLHGSEFSTESAGPDGLSPAPPSCRGMTASKDTLNGRTESPLGAALAMGAGVLSTRRHPELEAAARWAMRQRRLVRIFPRVYVPTELIADTRVRAAALCAADPAAVITGRTAAALTWAPALSGGDIEAVSQLRPKPGYRFVRRTIHPELVIRCEGSNVLCPAASAVELVTDLGGRIIDEALRAGITLEALWQALELAPGRRGNAMRRRLLRDSRDQPWSEAERLAHELLRAALIHGWRANVLVGLPAGSAYLDIAFERLLLAFEIDGFEFHGSRQRFTLDRERDAQLALRGWRVIRVPATMVFDTPEKFVELVRGLVAQQEAGRTGPTTKLAHS